MNHALLLLVLSTAGEELPQHRHARLVKEAAESFATWKTPDPVRAAELAAQVQQHHAAWPAPTRGWADISPYAIAGLGVCGVALLCLIAMTWLVARPVGRAGGLNQQRIQLSGNKRPA